MKKIIAVSLVVLTSVFLLFLHFSSSKGTEKIQIDGESFQVELATTDAQRYQGLSGRKNLCPNCGMLFVFSQDGDYPFTMRGMNFSLDMVWINDGKIVAISKNVPVNQQIIDPKVNVDHVLELNAGTTDKVGMKIGDSLN
jgi:uncharacterized membrane protein (UPF0127 family)